MGKRVHLSMVGRDKEIETFQSLLARSISGHGSTMFVLGEAGIGKTRLVEELGKFCDIIGSRMLVGHCLPGAPTPYLPFMEAMRETGDAGKRLCIEVCSSPPEKIMFDVLDWVRSLSEGAPLVLVLEDLHWADTNTVQLMHFLSRNIADHRVLLVGTFRPEELAADGDSPHPLVETLRVIRREGRCYEIDLKQLKEVDVEQLINALLSGRSHFRFVDLVVKETEGNPLFVIEMVNLLLQAKELEKHEGFWNVKGRGSCDIPPTVREVVLRRVERLPRQRRRLLECASVAGMTFDVDTLADVLGGSRLEVIEGLEELENPHSLIYPLQQEDFTFSHEAVMRAVYDGIGESKRKELHRMMAARLEGMAKQLKEECSLAHHLEQAGDLDGAVQHHLMAGEGWLRCQGVFEAAPHFQKVLDRTKERPERLAERMRALEGLADCHYSQADYRRTDELLREFIGLSGQEDICARILRKRAECWGPARLGMGSSDTFVSLLDQADGCASINDFERGEICSARALYHMWQGDYFSANHYSRLAEEWFERSGDQERYLSQLLHHIYVYLSLGDMERALGNIERAKEVQSRVGGRVGEAEIQCVLGEILLQQGRYQEALDTLARGRELTSQLGDHIPMCWCQIYSVLAYHLLGMDAEAGTEGDRAVQFADEAEIPYTIAMALGLRALVSLRAGRREAALEDLGRAEATVLRLRSGVRLQAPGLVEVVKARVQDGKGDRKEAEHRFEKALSLLHGCMTSLLLEGLTHAWYGEALERWGRKDDSIEHYEQARGIFTVLGNQMEEARASRSLRLLNVREGDVAIAK